jgi:hypothetical protein
MNRSHLLEQPHELAGTQRLARKGMGGVPDHEVGYIAINQANCTGAVLHHRR